MEAENQNFSQIPLNQEQLRQIMTSPEGQALIRLLQRDGGKGLQAAAQSLQRGDTEAAKAALSPLLEQTDGANLAQRLREKL